ncbi:Type I restriction-modification system, DNA-methyltransferase subunit M [Enhygromyxa salina]|uniref:site-specific DNA-methyltransferase (adenine-specific) n=1 Tax=Enhygromyxa salina TaxID=215803 RepID=A0A0C2CZD8_9BACT|nr:N-6 DNA methylase [Enhygromyxa salina]KIG16336.1 Type I restriction-modification system, DNA-methyltransferase subunit M [Enhygromyxa salina]
MNTTEIVARLWNLCNVLRDDGITYHEYVTELTFLLFLKMEAETAQEAKPTLIPEGWRWSDLAARDGIGQLNFYRTLLVNLSQPEFKDEDGALRKVPELVTAIFANASTALRQPKNLTKLVENIDSLDWYSARSEGLGDLYEGLLEKNAGETKSGAGQYFTPRALIDCIVELVQPQAGERVQDPAAGTGGFLVAADRYIKQRTDDLFDLGPKEQRFQVREAIYGMELVPDTHRLLLMNLMLHGIEGRVELGDTLSPTGAALGRADLMLSNPPFGTKKGGGGPSRDDFTFSTSNKQLAFLQHIYRGLKPGGRAAVVLPDNVLFEDNVGQQIRGDLMDKCRLHTILRLPTGIFYAQGVKTNVLFFERGQTDKGNTEAVWVYDLRTNMPSFGKRTPFGREHLLPFMEAYGGQADGRAKRVDGGEEGRFRCFEREVIRRRGDNLDLSWLRDENTERAEDLPPPEEIAGEILEHLRTAMGEMEALMKVLEG